ncbi:hypothetical protein Q9L42_019320 [Methylomarinum sp. Ch1-1]|uniref:MSHA biogenesis protein MshJ n=1 Tax=Methylomarinum roseum TaxID=3067653 RepID=A0AAU7NTX1_9GAMM|nr:hypothetical protein [Methylomarinum sp. Ch1-1]MDP4519456.1 hypothetical protein [Methylomarinum sp. Ch1-1]
MTPEQQRELWLKRVLPGLVISVIYFVFISGIVSDKAKTAEDAYRKLMQRGISSAALPSLESQKNRLQDELIKLKQRDEAVQNGLSEKAGFLYGQSDGHEAIDRIAVILAQHRLRITEESVTEQKKVGDMPQSIADVQQWLGEALKSDDAVKLQQIGFVGRYVDVYAMMQQLADENIKALPVSLTMTNLNSDDRNDIGLKKWLLELWI